MQRIALEVAYDGTDFQGSQGQTRPGARTVDGTLKNGLESLLGQRPRLLWASRTDSGVHAQANVCVFDADLSLPAEKLPSLLNGRLPADLRVLRQFETVDGFHPRFDALERTYEYRLSSPSASPADWRFSWELEDLFDLAQMALAARLFSGEYDYAAFAASTPGQGSTLCTVLECGFTSGFSYGGRQASMPAIAIRVRANRFLRHMVCRMVGALVAVGRGELNNEDIRQALSQQKRLKFKPAPPRGLTLIKVTYQDKLG